MNKHTIIDKTNPGWNFIIYLLICFWRGKIESNKLPLSPSHLFPPLFRDSLFSLLLLLLLLLRNRHSASTFLFLCIIIRPLKNDIISLNILLNVYICIAYFYLNNNIHIYIFWSFFWLSFEGLHLIIFHLFTVILNLIL